MRDTVESEIYAALCSAREKDLLKTEEAPAPLEVPLQQASSVRACPICQTVFSNTILATGINAHIDKCLLRTIT